MDHHKKTLVKTVSWRIIASLTTMGLVFFFTGKWALTLEVGVLEVVLKMMFYYVHERLWNRTPWGNIGGGK